MAHVVDAAKMEWQSKATPRSGQIDRKPLAKGTPGKRDNFEFNIYRYHPGYGTPRHRHTFEQMRIGLSGSITYLPKKSITPGVLVSFPEGAYYGPQQTEEVTDQLLLQYGGASGQGYLSQEQLIQARAELAENGTFENGIYSVVDDQGIHRRMDAVEAIYEHVFGVPVKYIEPRTPDPVAFNIRAHHWIPSETPGLQEKSLCVFTERRAGAVVYEAISDAKLGLDAGRRELVYTFDGDLEVDGDRYGTQAAVFLDTGDDTVLSVKPGWQGLVITLP